MKQINVDGTFNLKLHRYLSLNLIKVWTFELLNYS